MLASIESGKVKRGSSIVTHIHQLWMYAERFDVAIARRAHEFLHHAIEFAKPSAFLAEGEKRSLACKIFQRQAHLEGVRFRVCWRKAYRDPASFLSSSPNLRTN